MRDPQASLNFEADKVVRRLRMPLAPSHFLRSVLARRWVEEGHLVPFEILDEYTVTSPLYSFVTQPSEWCDAQLFEAGQLTLALQQQAVAEGFDLKDASAWNVIFDGLRPVFCDLMSFVALDSRKWWAAGQFARHFVLPLVVAQRRGLRACEVFKVWRDGLPPAVGRQMLGWSRYLTRYWPLVAAADDRAALRSAQPPATESRDDDPASITRFRRGLQASLSWMLDGVRPAHSTASTRQGAWLGYVSHRSHYPGSSVERKRETIAAWLAQVRPAWVADLGCNDGEFSAIALESGAHVVAIDSDHACIDALFRRQSASDRLFPVIAVLDDLNRGRGWAGTEYTGLTERLAQRVDLVMMLALVHHLAVAASVPMNVVAAFAAHCTRRWLIVELIGEADPQLALLCAQRQRTIDDFSIERQRAAFLAAGFAIEDEFNLAPAARTLLLLRLAS